jgi:membrane protease YdiL (CAAX protease family)
MMTPAEVAAPAPSRPLPRSLELGLALIALLWLVAAHRAAHILSTLAANSSALYPLRMLIGALAFFALVAAGFTTLRWIAVRDSQLRDVLLLPLRATRRREVAIGLIVGWAIVLVAVLPMMLAGDLSPSFWFAPRAFGLAILALATLAVGTLAQEMAFRGFVLAHLGRALGPVSASLLVSLLYGMLAWAVPSGSGLAFLVAFVASLVLSMAYFRTHARWVSWGLHFGFSALATVVFGLPLAGVIDYTSVVQSSTAGSRALTGGDFGVAATWPALLAFGAALLVIYALTRDFAWTYTHPEIVSAGYAVVVQPPEAHTAMEQAAIPAPLIQILGSTPTAPSTMTAVNEHLQSNADDSLDSDDRLS